jgi:hypothetical protein
VHAPGPHSILQDWVHARAALSTLLADISPAWLAATHALLPPAPLLPSTNAVAALLLPRLGWRLGPGVTVTLRNFTIKMGMDLQMW